MTMLTQTIRFTFLMLLAGMMFSTGSASAADKAAKIGFVDVKAAATRSTSIQGAVKDAEQKLKLKQEEIEIQIRNYRSARQDLDTRKSVLSEDEVRNQEKKIEDLRDKVDAMQLEIDKELRRTETDIMGPAVDRIIAAVKKIGKEQGYDVILTNDIVIYGAETLDITPLVVQELDGAKKAK